MNKKLVIEITAVIFAILLAILVFYGWKIYYYKTLPKVEPIQEETSQASQTLGEQISKETITNPAETIPQTNPYEAKTNPFEEVKTNPFKDAYKNPFE